MSIQESLLSRLEKFLLEDVVNLTTGDELELEKIGEEKTALFIRMPDDNSFHFSGIGAHHTAFSAYDGTGRCTQHRQLTRAGAFCARGSAKYYVAGQLPKLGCDDAFAQHHIIDYSAKYIADQAYVPGRLGVRVRMCDEILYLGGNEQSTHEWISKAMGQETIDNRSYGTTHSWTSGSNSTNEQKQWPRFDGCNRGTSKNKLLKGKIGSVIMILADERPIIDEKYDLNRHPRIKLSADGGAPQYSYVSSALLPETNTIQINETDVDEDEVDGMFTFDLQNVGTKLKERFT